MTVAARLTLLFAGLALSGCTYLSGDPHVMVTSEPAGAEVIIDGESTGTTTPVRLELDGYFGDHHRITLRKQGYVDEERIVWHYRTPYTSRWIDGAADVTVPSLPLFWTLGDFVTPFAVKWRYVPHELYVVLYEEGKGPVSTGLPGEAELVP